MLALEGASTCWGVANDDADDVVAVLTVAGVVAEVAVDEVAAVGHRIVHGGKAFTRPVLLDRPTVERLRQLPATVRADATAVLQGRLIARSAPESTYASDVTCGSVGSGLRAVGGRAAS